MSFFEIFAELKSRGEVDITPGSGKKSHLICSRHGKYTFNYWQVINGQLECVDTTNGIIDLTYK